ncbi:ankyrin repeat domain-containing protein [Wolbachia pipientis]|uniref:ankyrin repeat domain-containing protein n=1 Tax=Wolbachia pipientis TaxID=955 RepID=UPI0025A43B30|nr:ankyrin repeat domain-containing protein [Wolbachia pipientis]MDM8335571.1 ankyrin repeat domain-containing protein [Wolbachia pipientis]
MPLHEACSRGHGNIVELLLKHGADPNARDEHGESLLHKALSCGHDDIVKRPLENGADPNIKDQKGKSLFRCVIDNYGDIDRYKTV